MIHELRVKIIKKEGQETQLISKYKLAKLLNISEQMAKRIIKNLESWGYIIHKLTEEDFVNLKRHIETQKKPLFFENKFGRFVLVLTENGKKRFLNEGFIAITVNELRNWVKDCKSEEEQRQKVLDKTKAMKEGVKIANKVKNLFEGTITNFK